MTIERKKFSTRKTLDDIKKPFTERKVMTRRTLAKDGRTIVDVPAVAKKPKKRV